MLVQHPDSQTATNIILGSWWGKVEIRWKNTSLFLHSWRFQLFLFRALCNKSENLLKLCSWFSEFTLDNLSQNFKNCDQTSFYSSKSYTWERNPHVFVFVETLTCASLTVTVTVRVWKGFSEIRVLSRSNVVCDTIAERTKRKLLC